MPGRKKPPTEKQLAALAKGRKKNRTRMKKGKFKRKKRVYYSKY